MKKQKAKYLLGPVATVYNSSPTGNWRQKDFIIDSSTCVQCLRCVEFCPLNIISIEKGNDLQIIIDFEYCKGCGICENICTKNCIKLVSQSKENNL